MRRHCPTFYHINGGAWQTYSGLFAITTVVGNAYINVGGRIGVWYLDAPNAFFDNFGGGNVP